MKRNTLNEALVFRLLKADRLLKICYNIWKLVGCFGTLRRKIGSGGGRECWT